MSICGYEVIHHVFIYARQEICLNKTMNFDYNAFSHGQIQSKIWLCENLEPHLPPYAQVAIIGSWYNTLGFIMLARDEKKYNMIMGVDKDQSSIDVANKLTDGWALGMDFKARNTCSEIEKYDFRSYNVVVNTSCEHMSTDWFTKVNPYQLVCIQSSDMVTDDPGWNITNSNSSLEEFKKKYPMSQILFEGEKLFDYGHLVYNRLMLIGRL
jgi:hypothetical protein